MRKGQKIKLLTNVGKLKKNEIVTVTGVDYALRLAFIKNDKGISESVDNNFSNYQLMNDSNNIENDLIQAGFKFKSGSKVIQEWMFKNDNYDEFKKAVKLINQKYKNIIKGQFLVNNVGVIKIVINSTNDSNERLKTYKIKNHDSGKTYRVRAKSYQDAKDKYEKFIGNGNSFTYKGHVIIKSSHGWKVKIGNKIIEFATDKEAKEYIDLHKDSFNDSSDDIYILTKNNYQAVNYEQALTYGERSGLEQIFRVNKKEFNSLVKAAKNARIENPNKWAFNRLHQERKTKTFDSLTEDATLTYIENYKGVKIYQNDDDKKYSADVYTKSFKENDLKTLKAKIDAAKNEYIKKYRNLDSYSLKTYKIKNTDSGKTYRVKATSYTDAKDKYEKFIAKNPVNDAYEHIVETYHRNGSKYRIIKAPNGKFFNVYGDYKEATQAGPYDTLEEARKMMEKHRPKAVKDAVQWDTFLANLGFMHHSGHSKIQKWKYRGDNYNDFEKAINHIRRIDRNLILSSSHINSNEYIITIEKPITDSFLDSRIAYYEVLWYEGDNERDALRGNFKTKEFKTKNEAMNFYRREKNDKRKFAFWITGRRPNGDLEEDVWMDATTNDAVIYDELPLVEKIGDYTIKKNSDDFLKYAVFYKGQIIAETTTVSIAKRQIKQHMNDTIKDSLRDASANYIENYKGVKIYQNEDNNTYSATVYTKYLKENTLKTLKAKIDEAKNEHSRKYRNLDSLTEDATIAQLEIKNQFLNENDDADDIIYLGFNDDRKISFYEYNNEYYAFFDLENRVEKIDKEKVQRILKKNIIETSEEDNKDEPFREPGDEGIAATVRAEDDESIPLSQFNPERLVKAVETRKMALNNYVKLNNNETYFIAVYKDFVSVVRIDKDNNQKRVVNESFENWDEAVKILKDVERKLKQGGYK